MTRLQRPTFYKLVPQNGRGQNTGGAGDTGDVEGSNGGNGPRTGALIGMKAEGKCCGGAANNAPIGDGAALVHMESKGGVCSIVSEGDGKVCSSKETLAQIKAGLPGASGNLKDAEGIIKEAGKLSGCPDEKCVLEGLAKKGDKNAQKDLDTAFKVSGPRDTTWLSNFEIDDVLKQWAGTEKAGRKKLKHQGFVMCDFASNNSTFAHMDLKRDVVDAGYGCMACVVNTDLYRNGGEHWMAIFFDCSGPGGFSIELFDSIGKGVDKCKNSFQGWVNEQAQKLTDQGHKTTPVVINKLEHQRSRSECGVYSLLYIWLRMHGLPYTFFIENALTDYMCFYFRQLLFEGGEEFLVNGNFDLNKYMKSCNVEWEKGMQPYDAVGTGALGNGKPKNNVDGTGKNGQKKGGAKSILIDLLVQNKGPLMNEDLEDDEGEEDTEEGEDVDNMDDEEDVDNMDDNDSEESNLDKNPQNESPQDEEQNDNQKDTEGALQKHTTAFDKIFPSEYFKSAYNYITNKEFTLGLPEDNESKLTICPLKYKLFYENETRGSLLADIYFITKFGPKSKSRVIVYDRHVKYIELLSEFFDEYKFHIYGAKNASTDRPNIKLQDDNIEDTKYKEADGVLFISSDLFRFDKDKNPLDQYLAAKRNIARDIKALHSSFNFYVADKCNYCPGDVYIYPWSKKRTERLKLFTRRADIDKDKEYNMELLSYNLYLHNYFRRFWAQYNHGIKVKHVCGCWDCTAEAFILDQYVLEALGSSKFMGAVAKAIGGRNGHSEVKIDIKKRDEVSKLMKYISHILGPKNYLAYPPHGVYVNLPPNKKLEKLIFNFVEFL